MVENPAFTCFVSPESYCVFMLAVMVSEIKQFPFFRLIKFFYYCYYISVIGL